MRLLFVCSGNICRSPFAEVLARDLTGRGDVEFSSAGTFAIDGDPATATGVAVAGELGLDMRGHRATRLNAAVLRGSDLVYGMEQEHVIAAKAIDPGARLELLSPDGAAIPDPYGGDRDDYRNCYALIREALAVRIED